MQAHFEGFTFVDESAIEKHMNERAMSRAKQDEKEDDDWEKVPGAAVERRAVRRDTGRLNRLCLRKPGTYR